MDVEWVMEIKEKKESWMTPIKDYLLDRTLQIDERRKLLYEMLQFIIQGVMYRRVFSVPLLWCVIKDEAEEILMKVHEGSCSDHTWGSNWQRKFFAMDNYGRRLTKMLLITLDGVIDARGLRRYQKPC